MWVYLGKTLIKVVPNKVKLMVKYVKKWDLPLLLSVRHEREMEKKSLEKHFRFNVSFMYYK